MDDKARGIYILRGEGVRIYVVRHGESETNAQGKWAGRYDTPLTPKGMEQARQAAADLTGAEVDVMISSSLLRARQTAEIIRAVNHAPLVVSDEFVERNMGVYEGLTPDEVMEVYPDLWNRQCSGKLDDAPTNGETYRELYIRITGALERVKRDYADRSVLLVTHGFVAQVINWYCNRLSFEEMFRCKIIGNCEVVPYTLR